MLEATPTLIGYRLLLGLPQKKFYRTRLWHAAAQATGSGAPLRPADNESLPAVCGAMSCGLADLVRQMSPTLTDRDLAVPLLALGSQFQGRMAVRSGTGDLDVFRSIAEIVSDYIFERSDRILKVRDASGRILVIALRRSQRERPRGIWCQEHDKVALEIKGVRTSAMPTIALAKQKSRTKRPRTTAIAILDGKCQRGLNMRKLEASRRLQCVVRRCACAWRVGSDLEDFRNRLARPWIYRMLRGRDRISRLECT